MQQARKGFLAFMCDEGNWIFSKFWDFFLKILWGLFGIFFFWKLVSNFCGIFWDSFGEFFGKSLGLSCGILWKVISILKELICVSIL